MANRPDRDSGGGAPTTPFVGPILPGTERPNVPVLSEEEIRRKLQEFQDRAAQQDQERAQHQQTVQQMQPQQVDLTPQADPHTPGPWQLAADLNVSDGGDAPSGLPVVAWQLAGTDKLKQRMATAPSFARQPGTHDYDQWLLTLPFEKGDSDYNIALGSQRAQAIERERRRGQNMSGVDAYQKLDPQVVEALNAGVRAKTDRMFDKENQRLDRSFQLFTEQGQREHDQEPYIVNAYGDQISATEAEKSTSALKPPRGNFGSVSSGGLTNELLNNEGQLNTDDPVDDPTAGGGGSPPSGTRLKALTGPEKPQTKKQLEASGKVIWMGRTKVPQMVNGVQVMVEQDRYMSVNDAYYGLAAMANPDGSPSQAIASFQHMNKLKPTGVVDKKTRDKWGEVVTNANYLTTAGIHVDMMTVAQMSAGQTSGGGGGGGGGGRRRGGGGGGGGGGGAALVPADQAKYLLNQTMQKYAGREATAAEFASFLGAIKGAAASPDFNGQQFAIDWVKSALPQAVGSFQAGTDYYQVIQQLIGGA